MRGRWLGRRTGAGVLAAGCGWLAKLACTACVLGVRSRAGAAWGAAVLGGGV